MSSWELDAVLSRLRGEQAGSVLDEAKLKIIPDTMRLKPAIFDPTVLTKVLSTLVQDQVLQVSYRDKDGKLTAPCLHPQGLLQRGPRVYLFALKDEEHEVRMYALHRMIKAEVIFSPARKAINFNLDAALYNGQADFAGGEHIELKALVRGYVAELLYECPLDNGQNLLKAPEGSSFEAQLTVHLPESGQLLRWLLGCGDNIKVLEPERMRNRVSSQAKKMAALYD